MALLREGSLATPSVSAPTWEAPPSEPLLRASSSISIAASLARRGPESLPRLGVPENGAGTGTAALPKDWTAACLGVRAGAGGDATAANGLAPNAAGTSEGELQTLPGRATPHKQHLAQKQPTLSEHVFGAPKNLRSLCWARKHRGVCREKKHRSLCD